MIGVAKHISNRVAAWRWRRTAGVTVGEGVRVNFRRINGTFSRLLIGAGTIIEGSITADKAGAAVLVGNDTFIGDSKIISARGVTIGSHVLISWDCCIVDHDSHSLEWVRRRGDVARWHSGKKDWDDVNVAEVVIEDDVWIGFGASVLKGVRIGQGAVIGAKSVVVRSVPARTLVAGNPARVIRDL